jgi:hypothetical protein
LRNEGRNPNILVARTDPEGGTAAEYGRFSVYLALNPAGVIFEK